MATIVNGMVMGVRMYGEVTESDVRNFADFTAALENLKKSLAKMFDDNMAELVMKNILADTKITITDGEVENLEMWENLYKLGVVNKSESQKQKEVNGNTRELLSII